MPKETGADITSFETENRKLAYANDFRDMLREHPRIIKTAISLADKASAEYDPPPVKYKKFELRYDKQTGKWLEEQMLLEFRDGQYVRDENGEVKKVSGGWVPMKDGRGTILCPTEPLRDEDSGLEVTVLGKSNRALVDMHITRHDVSEYLKLDFEGSSYFVKKSLVTVNPGFNEFHNTVTAKKALADLDFVTVVDAQLGYQDKKQSWYISKWKDVEAAGFTPSNKGVWIGVDDYGNFGGAPEGYEAPVAPGDIPRRFSGFPNETEYKEANRRIKMIEAKLEPFRLHRDLDANLFYNFKTRQFILLDVTGENNEFLGNPLRR